MNPLLKEIRHNPLLWLLVFVPAENRMDLALRLQLAVNIPIIPADKPKP